MDRGLAWALYFISLVGAILIARGVLRDVKSGAMNFPASSAAGQPGAAANPPKSGDGEPVALWFESLAREIDGEKRIRNADSPGALSEIDKAIGTMNELQREHPAFRPAEVDYRLMKLRELRDLWTAPAQPGTGGASLNGISPPDILDLGPRLEVPPVASTTIKIPAITLPKVPLPKIETSLPAIEDSPGGSELPGSEPAGEILSTGKAVDAREGITMEGRDPSSIWYRALLSACAAGELEKKGETDRAKLKYEESREYYEILNRDFPELKSEHIRLGPKRLLERLNQLAGN